jgi:hypothetical protein
MAYIMMSVFTAKTAHNKMREPVLYTGNDIIEEPDAVIPHVRICVGASQ